MTVLAIVVMAKYKLTDAFHAQILGEIKARRALEASGSEPFGAEAESATPVERAASELASSTAGETARETAGPEKISTK
ncbi:hypothetical protein AHiyo8_52410 [Arthrobacter sp. Hiyo8]|nr:hypothetical protein AHiyo8_52410 [Arthrobacter sp. Hiyo8]